MTPLLDPDILKACVEEVLGYLDIIDRRLARQHHHPPGPEALKEVAALAGTIQRACRMVGLTDLAETAAALSRSAADPAPAPAPRPGHMAEPEEIARSLRALCRKAAGGSVSALPPPDAPPPLPETGPAVRERRPPPTAARGFHSAISRELLEGFYDEAREHLDVVESLLQELRRSVTRESPMTPAHMERVRQIRRAIHTLKGAAAVVGQTAAAEWSHTMEDFLDAVYDHGARLSPPIIHTLTEAGDLLSDLVAAPGKVDPRRQELLAEALLRLTARRAGAPPPAPPEAEPETPPPPRNPASAAEDHRLQTLRLKTTQITPIHNLTGELIIDTNALHAHLRNARESLDSLDRTRRRLLEIARELDVTFEQSGLSLAEGSPARERPMPGDPHPQFDALELDRYTRLSLIIRNLNDTATDMNQLGQQIHQAVSEIDSVGNHQQIIVNDLQDRIMRLQMMPVATLSSRLHRTVREIGSMLDKPVELQITGEALLVDRVILEKVSDPLMHLIRNAIDHGIEPKAVRKAAGKPAAGRIALQIQRNGSHVTLSLMDDGGGIDTETIRQKAVQSGFITPDTPFSDQMVPDILFRPGFSTKSVISPVSGRGVGMDVVRENIRMLSGEIRMNSLPGAGTRFMIRIPLRIMTLRGLMVRAGDRVFAIPISEVRDIFRPDPGQAQERASRGGAGGACRTLRYGEKPLPLLPLRDILSIPGSGADPPYILIVETGGHTAALAADQLMGQQELVVKGTGSHLRHVRGVAGVSITGEGRIVPILRLAELVDAPLKSQADSIRRGPPESAGGSAFILVVDDSASVRQVLTRLLVEEGWLVRVAKNGQDALRVVEENIPDLILLDIEMPVMNGYELLSRLKSTARHAHIPVIMLTSRVSEKHRLNALALGASGFMGKPFDRDEIIRRIRFFVAPRRGGAADAS